MTIESEFQKDNKNLSAYEKAAKDIGADPRVIPIKLEKPAPTGAEIVYPDYSAVEQRIWQILFDRQSELIKNRSCKEFLQGQKDLQISRDTIPYLSRLSEKLKKSTKWEVARIPGLLHEGDFFGMLADAVFPSTDYIRTMDELEYTPAPDMFHDIFGHMPLITQPSFARFYQKYGQVAANATGLARRQLETIYWFTVEFGLIATADGTRIYGAGILSSPKEIIHSLTDAVEKIPFEPEMVSRTEYDVWHLQDKLFVIDSFEDLEQQFFQWVDKNGLNP